MRDSCTKKIYLCSQFDWLLRITGDRTGAGLQGRHVRTGSVEPQLVQVMLKHPKKAVIN